MNGSVLLSVTLQTYLLLKIIPQTIRNNSFLFPILLLNADTGRNAAPKFPISNLWHVNIDLGKCLIHSTCIGIWSIPMLSIIPLVCFSLPIVSWEIIEYSKGTYINPSEKFQSTLGLEIFVFLDYTWCYCNWFKYGCCFIVSMKL